MRGLTLFITDLRKCKGKEDEIKRINKELANIRSKFKGDKPLSGYHKKKYVCKLLFMFLLGHKCDLGQMEAVNLLSSNAYSEKQIGYLFISVVMRENHSFLPLVMNSLKIDLVSNNMVIQNLALQFIANSSNKDMADTLTDQVLELLLSSETGEFVKQTSALTLLQLLRTKPSLTFDESTANRLIHLISNLHLGVVTASISLIDFLVKNHPSQYECCLSHCVVRLSRIVTSAYIDFQDYTYYSIAAPWLTVKLLKLLKNFSAPTDIYLKARLRESLEIILNKAQEPTKSKKIEQNNAKYAVIFEAICLIIQMEFEVSLLYRAVNILGSALNLKEANLRFMALDMMAQLTNSEVCLGNIRMYWETVLNALKTERDTTIKKRAIDLLFNICDGNNVKLIVEEMLYYLQTGNDSSQEVILKTASLAEQFRTDLKWYVHTILTLLQVCEDNVDDSVWYTLTKVITDNPSIQEYAATAAFKVLHQNPCHDTVVKFAGYVLGEFGYLIAKDNRSSNLKQLSILHEKYPICSHSTRAILLTAYMKFCNRYPDLKFKIQSILREKVNAQSENIEIQQRAVEYLRLSQIASKSLLDTVLEEMPSCNGKQSVTVETTEKNKSHIFQEGYDTKTLSQDRTSTFPSTMSLCPILECTNENKMSAVRSVSHSNLNEANGPSNLSLLMEVFKDTPMSVFNYATPTHPVKPVKVQRSSNHPNNDNFLLSLLFNDSGVLFDDDYIRILVKCEFKRHFGRFHLTYQNRSLHVLTDFTVKGLFAQLGNKCSVWFKPSNSVLDIQGSMEQDMHIECLSEFSVRPSLSLRFTCNKVIREVKIILPLSVNKFTEPVSMSPKDFHRRWENLGRLGKDVVKDFSAKYPMIYGVTRLKLGGFRVAVIENVDANPENFYCAGIFYTRTSRIGFLIRLVRFPAVNRYLSTVRSNQISLSQNISNLLFELL